LSHQVRIGQVGVPFEGDHMSSCFPIPQAVVFYPMMSLENAIELIDSECPPVVVI